jgi:hypothetical protein
VETRKGVLDEEKQTVFAGMAAMALTFGLILTGCPTDADDDDGGNGNGNGGGNGGGDSFVWTACLEEPLFSGLTTSLNGVVWGGTTGHERFVAVGNASEIAYSSDGITWTAVTTAAFNHVDNTKLSIQAVTWGGDKFIAVGHFGRIAYSTDGTNWTKVDDSTFATDNDSIYIFDIAYGGDKFVAVGTGGKIAYSTDGTTWMAVSNSTFETTDRIFSISYGGGKFVAVGTGGKIAYSTNGTTWTKVSDSTLIQEIFDITYGGGKFVAVGLNSMAYSTDGITWTKVDDSNNPFVNDVAGYQINSVGWGGGKFVVAGLIGGTELLSDRARTAYSTDGASWTTVSTAGYNPAGGNFYDITYGGAAGHEIFIAVGDSIIRSN